MKINTKETRIKQNKKRKRDIQQATEYLIIKREEDSSLRFIYSFFAAFFGFIGLSAHFLFSSFSFWICFWHHQQSSLGFGSFQGKQKSSNLLLETLIRFSKVWQGRETAVNFLNLKEILWTAYQYSRTVVEIVFSRIWTVEMSNDYYLGEKQEVQRWAVTGCCDRHGPDRQRHSLSDHKRCYRDETRANTLDRLRENQEETGGSSGPQAVPKLERKSPSSHRPCHYPWRRGTRGHSSWPSCSTGADLPNVWELP